MFKLQSCQALKHRRKSVVLVSMALFSVVVPKISCAYHLPRWEFGLGAGVLNAPHYRGSKTVEPIYLPVPYITYRGDILKVDREGIRSELFQSDRIRLDISLAGNIPVPESDDSARAGMPRLDPLGEIGPELEFNLWNTRNHDKSLWFKLPFRVVFSVGNPILAYQGWSLSPYINFRLNVRKSNAFTKFEASVGPLFANHKYHNYFYQVESKYITPDRPEYSTSTGYSGSRITFTVSRNTRRFFLGAFARYDNLSGAIFEDSPLVETNDYFIYGVAFAWKFSASSTKVPHQD